MPGGHGGESGRTLIPDRDQLAKAALRLFAELRTARMDERTAINVGAAALVAALLVVAYVIRWFRLRQTKRRMGEFLAGYFDGDLPFDQLARRAREAASRSFLGSPECQALVQAAFQRSAEAKLAGKAYSLETERKLLTALADVKSEFGLPDRYVSEGWKAGRE
jgi:hypothetical protein